MYYLNLKKKKFDINGILWEIKIVQRVLKKQQMSLLHKI